MTNVLKFVPGQVYQGSEEQKAWTINVGNWFTTPTGASTVVKDRDGSDVTSSVISGATTISTSFVTTGCLKSLTAGSDYRVEVKIQEGGEILEGYFIVTGAT